MPAYVQDASVFAHARHALAHLLFEHVNLPIVRKRLVLTVDDGTCPACWFSRQCIGDLLEYPRAPECGTTYHDSIHTVALESLTGLFRRANVTVSDYWNMHSRISLHLTDERPVGFASVHLRTRPTVYGEGGNATVLQLLRQFHNNLMVGIPTQARLHGDGHLHGVHHGARDGQHLRYVL